MSLFNKFKKKTKKETVRENREKRREERAKEKEPQKPVRKAESEFYRLIKGSHPAEKATALAEQGKYVFKIYGRANKTEIKKAVESFYGKKVAKVNITRIVPKRRRIGRREGWKAGLKKGLKKAIVTLAKGEKIEAAPR